MKIQKLSEKYYDQAVKLQVECFGTDWESIAHNDFQAALQANHSLAPTLFIGIEDNKVIGSIMSSESLLYSNIRSWSWISVKESHRNQNVGRTLLQYAEKDTIQCIFAHQSGSFMVIPSANHGFYTKCGYHETNAQIFDGKKLYIKNFVAA